MQLIKKKNIGSAYYYKIKGSNEGIIWGDHIFDHDSNIAKASVFEGKCKLGEEKIVRILMVEGKHDYSKGFKNGIQSKSCYYYCQDKNNHVKGPASYIIL